jgi:hypothetical protein
MATLTIRYDIPAPRFIHGFVYEGEETERTALKEAMRKVAAKAGIDTETWLQSVVPLLLPLERTGCSASSHGDAEKALAAYIGAKQTRLPPTNVKRGIILSIKWKTFGSGTKTANETTIS